MGLTGGILTWRNQDVWIVCGVAASVGTLLSVLIAKRAVSPARRLLDQQDKLASSAVHEARSPLARLRAVVASKLNDDEDLASMFRASRQLEVMP
jgi:hypothetical protein